MSRTTEESTQRPAIPTWPRTASASKCTCCTVLKSNLCVPKKGIAWPQSPFLHSYICERFIYSIPRIGPHIWLQQNRQIDPGNI
jgi:hypothetical protein